MSAIRDRSKDPDGRGVEWGKERRVTQAQRTAHLEDELVALRKEVHALSESIKGLVETWKSAKFLVVMIGWLGAIGTAIVGIKAGFNALRPGP